MLRVLPTENGNSGVLFVGFNQDFSCFAIGMQNGFRIYNTDPLRRLERCEFNVRDGTGIGLVEMLYRTNFVGLLGGGHQARIPANTACLWDGVDQKFILELSYGSDVKAIRLRRDRILIVLSNAVKLYTFSCSPQLLFQTATTSNPLGLCHLCQSLTNDMVAFPGARIGSVLIASLQDLGSRLLAGESSPGRPPRQILAHENGLVAITMSLDGSLLATASQRGTLVRVFSTRDCDLLQELRRGSNPALITCVSFDATSSRVCVASDHGTVHIFSGLNWSPEHCLKREHHLTPAHKSIHQHRSVQILSRYFSSTPSQIKCNLETKFKVICGFGTTNSDILIVLAADGSYYKYNISSTGSITREASLNFLDFYDEENDH